MEVGVEEAPPEVSSDYRYHRKDTGDGETVFYREVTLVNQGPDHILPCSKGNDKATARTAQLLE